MTTNLLATIAIVLSTNVTEHWPQKQDGTIPNPDYAKYVERHSHDYGVSTLEYCPPFFARMVDDTNADTKSVEYTVRQERWLSFEFEGHGFREDIGLNVYGVTNGIDNQLVAHWQVEMQRVRTNGYSVTVTNETRTKGDWAWKQEIEIWTPYQTNYWVATGTNAIIDTHGFITNKAATDWSSVVTNLVIRETDD